MTQKYLKLDASDVLGTTEKLHEEGYRMVQICGVTKEGYSELLYSFDKDHDLVNYKVDVPFGTSVMSITPVYWAAFVYENEIHDLFGIDFMDSKLDYKGNFFRMSAVTPWKGKDHEEGA